MHSTLKRLVLSLKRLTSRCNHSTADALRALRTVATLGIIWCLPHMMSAQSPSETLIAVNQADADISIVDIHAGKEVARVAEGAVAGHEVATSLDGKLAYIPIYGDSSVGEPGSDGRKLLVLSLQSHKIVDQMDFGHGVRPHCIVMNPHDGLLYVTTELDRSVTIIDPKTLKTVGAIPTGQEQSHMLVLSHDGHLGYTANVGPGSVSVLDLITRKLIRVIKVSGNVQRISISPDDRLVFTADQTSPRMAAIDTTSKSLKAWITLPAVAYGSGVTNDGRWLLATLPNDYKVAVVDLETMKVTRTIAVPKGPHTVLFSPDNRTAYVACMKSDQIAVINLQDWSVERLIPIGRNADGIGLAMVPPATP